MKIIGAALIISISFFAGYLYTENQRKRISDISSIQKLVEHIGVNIQMFRTPLDEIYRKYESPHLNECDFFNYLDRGIYYAAESSGLLHGDEEKEILLLFDEKIGTGSADDSVSLCKLTSEKLTKLGEKLSSDLPERQKAYRTIFIIAGISIIIILI